MRRVARLGCSADPDSAPSLKPAAALKTKRDEKLGEASSRKHARRRTQLLANAAPEWLYRRNLAADLLPNNTEGSANEP